MKKTHYIFFAIIVPICIISIMIWRANRTIGTMAGAENEKVVLEHGAVYVLTYDSHTYRDRGKLLGKVKGAYGTSYFVFSVRDDPRQDYIYVASMGQGDFYKKLDKDGQTDGSYVLSCNSLND